MIQSGTNLQQRSYQRRARSDAPYLAYTTHSDFVGGAHRSIQRFLLAIAVSLPVSILAAGPPGGDEIPVLHPPHAEISPTFMEQYGWWVLAVGLGLTALLGFVTWLLMRPQPLVVIPPEVQARQALAILPSSTTDGATLSRVSQILRHYVRRAFELPPEELTTAEFCRVISENPKIGLGLAMALGDFLRDNDVRKFAPGGAEQPQASAITVALMLIEKCEARRASLRAAEAGVPTPGAPK